MAEPMIIEERLPGYDVAVTEHLVVAADPVTTWHAARELDLATHTPPVDAVSWLRRLPERVNGRTRRLPAGLRHIGNLPCGWRVLDEREGHEVAFGAVGRFWRGWIAWRDVDPADFAAFGEPGYGKVACSLSVRPYGPHRTLLTYECRTATMDPATRRAFARYWVAIRPFARRNMRGTLAAIAADAERRASEIAGLTTIAAVR